MALRLNVVVGSTRPGRAAPVVARWVEEVARDFARFDVALVDLADFNLPLLDEAAHPMRQQYAKAHTKAWSRSVASADAYLFVTPEYDYFAPAALVNAIQTVLVEWFYKPAGIVSYGGISGGLRSAQALRQLLGNVNVHALPQVVPVPFFQQFIGEDGLLRPNEQMNDGLKGLLSELHKWTVALKTIRTDERDPNAVLKVPENASPAVPAQ